MRKACLIGGSVLLALSIGCIGVTVVEMAGGVYGMGSVKFWGAAAFHALSALAAGMLVYKAQCPEGGAKREEQT